MRRASLFALCSAALTFVGCRGWESDQPPVHLVPNMDTQEKGKAYRRDTSGLFADGRVMRLPVEGTVAVGHVNDDDLLHEGLGADGQPTLTYPVAIKEKLDDAFRARGEQRYQIYCTPCHGQTGDGKGVVASKGMQIPPANFLDARLKSMPVGKLYAAVKHGVNNGNMGSYAAQIPVEDRWAIVAHVRKLQKDADATVNEEGGENIVVAAQSKASIEHGALLYKAKGCNACHTLDGTKIVGPTFKGLFGKTEATSAGDVLVDAAYIKESVLTPLAKVVTGYPPAMPPQQLSDIELESIVLFIQQQK